MKKIAVLSLLAIVPAFPQQPKFELADVHVSTTSHAFAVNYGVILRNGRYIDRDVSMISLVSAAYGNMAMENIYGGPGWVQSDLFDVIAKVPEGTTMAQASLMLRSLLEDRFKLVAHQDMRPKTLYVLSVGKGESKLKPASGAGKGCQQIQEGGPGRGGQTDAASMPTIKVSCHNLTAVEIAQNLNQMARGELGHNVANGLELQGSWDFDLEWTPGLMAAKGADGISVIDAVDKQLGLKLELKDLPRPVLLIESVNRKPTPNPPNAATALAVAAAQFEAASIKPANPDDQHPMIGLRFAGSEIKAGGTLRQLIAMALQVSPNVATDLVAGLPKSADSQIWEITAKMPSSGDGAPYILRGAPQPPALSVQLEMLRALLVDEFEMKTHSENREVPVYALMMGSGKPKLTQADDSERSGCSPDNDAPKPVPNMGPMMSCKNISMAELAEFLKQRAGQYIDHPTVDATGLEGGWNFLIGWTAKGVLQQQSAPNPNQAAGAIAEASDPSGLSLFEAVQKELGLKLVKQTKSIPVIVVDHVNERPKD